MVSGVMLLLLLLPLFNRPDAEFCQNVFASSSASLPPAYCPLSPAVVIDTDVSDGSSSSRNVRLPFCAAFPVAYTFAGKHLELSANRCHSHRRTAHRTAGRQYRIAPYIIIADRRMGTLFIWRIRSKGMGRCGCMDGAAMVGRVVD